MSGWLLAFDESALVRSSADLQRIIKQCDRTGWQAFWQVYGTAISNWGCPDGINAAAPPQPQSRDSVRVLRAAARASALKRAELWEKAWHVHYPELSDDEAGFEVGESAEYEAIGTHIFTVGRVPEALQFLDEQPDVATNWVSHASVSKLWQLEKDEGFLLTVGENLSRQGVPLGHDLLTVRSMLEFAVDHAAALYLWDPGT